MYCVIILLSWLFLNPHLAYMLVAVWALLPVFGTATVVLEDALALLAGHLLVLILEALSAAVLFVSKHGRASVGA